MTNFAFYVYGIVNPEISPDLHHPGYEEIGSVGLFEVEGLGVVASMVPPGSIEARLSADPPDAAWIVPRALHHEQVLQAVMERAQVLPVRFGCVFATEAALVEAVGRHRAPIRDFLQRMADYQEWSLKATLVEGQAVEFLLRSDPVFSARFRALPDSPGTRYFLEKKLREEAHRAAIRVGKAAADRLHYAVSDLASGMKNLPARASEERGRHTLLRTAVLLDRGRKEALFNLVEEAAIDQDAIPLLLEPAGPWPLYHFCPQLEESVP